MAETADKKIYHSTSLEQAERARQFLLEQKPRPFVFVYIVESGYDLHVANEWGSHPDPEFVLKLEQLLVRELENEDDIAAV